MTRVVSDLGPYPTYYRHMAPLNLEGTGSYPLPDAPASVGSELIGQRIAELAWVIDTRNQADVQGEVSEPRPRLSLRQFLSSLRYLLLLLVGTAGSWFMLS